MRGSAQQRRTRTAIAGVVALVGSGITVMTFTLAPTAQAATGCAVAFQVNQWTGGFTANVRVTAGDTAVNGWTVTWTYPGDQRITNGWNATVTQTGAAVSAVNASFNGSLAPGGSAEFGVQGTYAASNATPTDFQLNGQACNGAPSPTAQPPTASATPGGPSSGPSNSPSGSPAPSPSAGSGCGSALFCDGLEDQTTSTPAGNWSLAFPDCQGTGAAVIDNTMAHQGSRSIRVNGTAGYCNHVFVASNRNLSSLGAVRYGRFYLRHTTALSQQHVTFMAQRDANDGAKDLRMGGQNGALQWNRASDDATLPEQSPAGVALSVPLPVNRFTCVEFLVDGTQGHMQTWVDGAEVAGLHLDGTPTHDIDSQWLARANWRPSLTDLRLGWESYGDGADTLWFDDIALGTTRIGC